MKLAIIVIAAIGIATGLLYRRRIGRERRNRTYGYTGFPPGRHCFNDRIEMFCGRRRD